MSTDVVDVKKIDPAAGLRKANECIAEAKRSKPAARLFDEFWREGELALLFGASGVGKSLLAVQVADAMARGTPLHGFVMPTGRRKVLYVDLSLSDAQFRERYSGSGDTPVPMSAKREKLSNADTASVGTRVSPLRLFRFPEKLYRGRPQSEMDLCDWIERTVEANAFQVVIVDDISAIKRTHDGIRETLACMRRLKQLRDKLGISILVLCDAFEPTDWWVSENDMKRSRVLCTVADSVFAMGRKRRPEGARYVVQTRSRSAQLFWDSRNAPVGTITRLASGLLGFEFDERFTPEMDEEKKRDLRYPGKPRSGREFSSDRAGGRDLKNIRA
jgi:KaiC/GvpD/RAD55 family RecA-like ATPase